MSTRPREAAAGGVRRPASARYAFGPMALALAALALSAPQAAIQAQEFEISGQIRPRTEGRTPVDDGGWDYFTSMRTRVGVLATLPKGVSVFAQFQDVRIWGSESSTLDFDAEGLDLHQGYLDLVFDKQLSGFFRAGRQEVNFGGQRLVGAVDWAQQARAFDGAKLNLRRGGHQVEFLASKIYENSDQNQTEDAEFLGAYGVLDLNSLGDLDLYWLFDRNASEDEKTAEHTFGARWVATFAGTQLRLEGSLQRGDREGLDSDAFMFGARWGGALGSSGFGGTLWYDYLSGDQDVDDGKAGTFNTLYATNHKFYGFYDLFVNIPANTGRHGLQDAALKTYYRPGGAWDVAADFHFFNAAEQRSLSTGSLAKEIDLTGRYRYSENLSLMAGYAYVWADDGIKEIGRLSEDGQWTYLMLNVTF